MIISVPLPAGPGQVPHVLGGGRCDWRTRLVPGPELVLGTYDLQLSHLEALARDGAVGIQMLSQNPNIQADRCGNGNWGGSHGNRLPVLLLVLPWHLMCGPPPPQVKAAI